MFAKKAKKGKKGGLTEKEIEANYKKNFNNPVVLLTILSVFYILLIAIVSGMNGNIQGVKVEDYKIIRLAKVEGSEVPELIEKTFAPW